MTLDLPKILVVDDEADSRAVICASLSPHPFEVLEAPNGVGCISTVLNQKVDLVLLDVMLPDIDGFQCCEILHRRLQAACPPILMVTALDDEASIARAFAAQATDFIPKPVNLSVLYHRIKRVLRERQLRQDLETSNSYLQRISRTDELTQLANRRYLMTVLTQEWRRLARAQQPLSLLLCDLDAFKQFNDTYGHLAGDRCLQTFAEVLMSSVERSTDLVARFGGEEFILLLPNTSLAGLETIDQRIRTLLEDCAIPHRNSAVARTITFSSGGVSTVPSPLAQPEQLIADADRALYAAKAQGRNRLVAKYCELSLA